MRDEQETRMDVDTLIVWLLDRGTTLYAHADQLYVNPGGTACHMHRVGEAKCTDRNCAMSEGDMALVLAMHEPELWHVFATEECCATCYDVDTDTWNEERVAVDVTGRPYLVGTR